MEGSFDAVLQPPVARWIRSLATPLQVRARVRVCVCVCVRVCVYVCVSACDLFASLSRAVVFSQVVLLS
jgi:hypothetical protein